MGMVTFLGMIIDFIMTGQQSYSSSDGMTWIQVEYGTSK